MRKSVLSVSSVIFAVMMLCICIIAYPKAVFADEVSEVEFSYDETDFKKALNNRSLSITVDGQQQTFAVKSKEIIDFKVKSKKLSSDKTAMTVKATMIINRDVASVKTNVTIKYQLKKNKWKVTNVEFSKTSLYRAYLKGSFTGRYTGDQGETKVVFKIDNVTKDGFATGTMTFSAIPTNPNIPTGSYNIKGGYDLETGKVTFVAGTWIEQPKGYYTLDFYGCFDLENKGIKGDHSMRVYPD